MLHKQIYHGSQPSRWKWIGVIEINLEHPAARRGQKRVRKIIFAALLASVFSLACSTVSAEISSAPLAMNTNATPLLTFTNVAPECSNALPVLRLGQSPASQPLRPGIYQTKPFTCMVRVPEQIHDDRISLSPSESPFIPTIKPDLHLDSKLSDGK